MLSSYSIQQCNVVFLYYKVLRHANDLISNEIVFNFFYRRRHNPKTKKYRENLYRKGSDPFRFLMMYYKFVLVL
jgi:hypothetical protein